MKFNEAIDQLKPSASMKLGISDAAAADVLNLAVGLPDVPPPAELSDLLRAGVQAGAHSKYFPSRGSKKALENLKASCFPNDSVDPMKELMLVSGAKPGMYLALKSVTNPGDRVVLMAPYWLSYPSIVKMCGAEVVVWSPTIDQDGNPSYSFDDLNEIMWKGRVSAIILNQPNNPSGQVFPKDFVDRLQKESSERNVWCIVDEVYRELAFDRSVPMPTGPNVIRVNSFSKSLSAPGLRLGWITANAEVIDHCDRATQHMMTCVCGVSHYAVENLPAGLLDRHSRLASETYRKRTESIRKILSEKNIPTLNSRASFYLLADLRATGHEGCEWLLNKAKIRATPGAEYGEAFEGWVRLCLIADEEKLRSYFTRLPRLVGGQG